MHMTANTLYSLRKFFHSSFIPYNASFYTASAFGQLFHGLQTYSGHGFTIVFVKLGLHVCTGGSGTTGVIVAIGAIGVRVLIVTTRFSTRRFLICTGWTLRAQAICRLSGQSGTSQYASIVLVAGAHELVLEFLMTLGIGLTDVRNDGVGVGVGATGLEVQEQ